MSEPVVIPDPHIAQARAAATTSLGSPTLDVGRIAKSAADKFRQNAPKDPATQAKESPAAPTSEPAKPAAQPAKETPKADAPEKPKLDMSRWMKHDDKKADDKKPDASAAPASEEDLPEDIKKSSPAAQSSWKTVKAETKRLQQELETEREARKKEKTDWETNRSKLIDAELFERTKQEKDQLSKQLEVLGLAMHPDFQHQFDERISHQIANVKASVPPEVAERLETVLKMPEGQYKRQQLAEIYGDLDEVSKSEVGAVNAEIRRINTERENALKNSGELRKAMEMKQKEQLSDRQRTAERAFENVLNNVDKDDDLSVLTEVKGDENWNNAVRNAKARAKDYFSGNMQIEDLAKAAVAAAALPVWKLQAIQQASYIKDLEDQIKALQGSEPSIKPGNGLGASAPADGRKTGFSDRVKAEIAHMRT